MGNTLEMMDTHNQQTSPPPRSNSPTKNFHQVEKSSSAYLTGLNALRE